MYQRKETIANDLCSVTLIVPRHLICATFIFIRFIILKLFGSSLCKMNYSTYNISDDNFAAADVRLSAACVKPKQI